ncbi:hypothetical protein FRC00_004184 [Tulasnella sp. 408]|nr:hypothetical protein FRC00_004184 [Tulasnella sp. 408]
MSECGRSLAKLAYSEGLIPSATYTSTLSEAQQSQLIDEAGPQVQEGTKISEGILEHDEIEPSFRNRQHKLDTCETIKTLRRSDVLARQQVLCFDKVLTRTKSQIIVDEERAGQVRFTFPRQLLPKDGSAFYCCPYFDQELEELRYCTLDGEDITGISLSIMQMARSQDLRSVLLLAKAEGMISKLPGLSTGRATQICPVLLTLHRPFGDGYAKSLRLDKALASGYVTELQLPTETAADVTLSLYLGPLVRTASFKSKAMPDSGRTLVQLVPYVHASGNLRLWDKEKSQDWEFEPGKVFERSPRIVKAVSPLLFDLGVREGFWATGRSESQGKKRDLFEMLENFKGLAAKLLEGAYAIYS